MKLILKILAGLVAVVVILVASAFVIFNQKSNTRIERPQFTITEEVKKGDLALGERIYKVRAGCIECHGANLGGVKVMDDPAMGSIYGANISPYKLKSWSDEEVAGAIRYGVHKEGRSLRFMPSFDFEGYSKEDIASLIAYLRSVPEVREESHANSFGPMARILSAFGQMPIMFPALVVDQNKTFSSKPVEGPTAEFGKYLANACTGCHGAEMRGGKIPGGDPSWPPAANARLGSDPIWTEAAFMKMIETGVSIRTGQPVRLPMPVALLKQTNETERKALWLYLSTLK